jgi:hypothetical protein
MQSTSITACIPPSLLANNAEIGQDYQLGYNPDDGFSLDGTETKPFTQQRPCNRAATLLMGGKQLDFSHYE